MRIGIDARELAGHPTGVGRYLSGLLSAWANSIGNRHELVLYTPRPLAFAPWPFEVRVLPGSGGTVWEQWSLGRQLRRDRIEAFFAPGYTAPLLSGVPTTVAVHDVSFCAHPEWFSPREGARRRFMSRRTAAAARVIVTISEFSKREIVTHLRVPAGRIRVIPPGIDPPRRATTDLGASASTPPRILYVGSIFNRRNIPQLVAATALVQKAHPDVALDLVGDNRSRPPIDVAVLLDGQAAPDRFLWHHYVSDAELATLYASAGAFAFLSEYEGLGLTPLEAMCVGVPSVLLDTPVARESCGDAALYVAKQDVRGTADALEAVLFDAPTRTRLLSAAPTVLARYNWDTAARQTLAAIEGS